MQTSLSTRRYDHPVAVTGGAGFLGREVVRQLQRQGCPDIRVVDIQPFDSTGVVGLRGVREFRLDLRHGDMSRAFDGAKTVLHLAACQYHTPLARSTYQLPFFPVNVDGTRRVLEAAERAGVERLVFVSTNMVYGLPRALPLTEEHPREPFGPYGQSKLAAERMLERAHGHKLQTAVVRPGLIVGPGRVGVIARIFAWVVRGRPVYLIGAGDNRYEMMASEDVASLVLAAGSGRAERHVAYNCAAREVSTMRSWVETVIARTRSTSSFRPLPAAPLKWSFARLEQLRLSPLRRDQYLIADIDYFMDAGLARRELGWQPRWTGEEAILDTLRWYLTQQHPHEYKQLIAELEAERLPELKQSSAAAGAALGSSSR
ncbi:MAG TPA: NAD(P)-dependent oxidoreductase, partial [Polyangiales bacterium]|jgi:nucleoside-diphosphate-sugar epimerase